MAIWCFSLALLFCEMIMTTTPPFAFSIEIGFDYILIQCKCVCVSLLLLKTYNVLKSNDKKSFSISSQNRYTTFVCRVFKISLWSKCICVVIEICGWFE